MQRLAALVPRPRLHLIRFHGVLTPNAKLHPLAVPQGPEVRERTTEFAAAGKCEAEVFQSYFPGAQRPLETPMRRGEAGHVPNDPAKAYSIGYSSVTGNWAAATVRGSPCRNCLSVCVGGKFD